MAGILAGRSAIVTGASSGNGRAIARALAREGASVMCSDIQKSALKAGYEPDIGIDTDDAIVNAGGSARFVSADVANASDVRQLVAETVAAFGRLDIMVNNAGTFTGLHSIVDETEAQWDATMNVNAKGVWLGCKYAITQFLKQDPVDMPGGGQVRGRVINIASAGGVVGLALEPAYCASKGAAVNLTRALAIDHAPDLVNINAICPGYLATAMVRPFLEDKDIHALVRSATPWPRVGTAEDVARTALFLASDEAQWMTGSILTIDGGLTAR